MKVLWSEEQQVLYVNGYQISGEFLRALTEEDVSTQPWRVMKRDKGIITMESHWCLDLAKLPAAPPLPHKEHNHWFFGDGAESVESRIAYALYRGQRHMREHFMHVLTGSRAPVALPNPHSGCGEECPVLSGDER